ncbi:putative ATP-grasp-modified RiPP [Streptomyces sp. NPDC095613]|uniref:putative ATP-grasp-modified RiPP n=1 Tax=Streptomyces sp. NPDC095613 TaxID=3155540 RepID=UPI003334416F
MVPFPVTGVEHTRTELDSRTQTARYYGRDGVLMQSPKHGTSSGTSPATNTGNPSDGTAGGGDSDKGNDTDQ